MTISAPPAPPLPPRQERRRAGRRRRWALGIVLVLAVCLVPVGVSYGQALTYPGQASFLVRTVEWVREHGGAPLVNLAENIYYQLHAPPNTPPAAGVLPVAPVVTAPAALPAPLPTLTGRPPLPGEGVWSAAGPTPGAVVTTFVRPDAQHGSVVAGVARFDQSRTQVHLVAGTKEPTGPGWPEGGQVPAAWRSGLVATFNSGFKMADAHGGFLADGRTAVGLRAGAASLVVDRSGRASIGAWGRDVGPGPGVVAVRQNLDLVVDGGAPVPGLNTNANGAWGTPQNQLQYTWRSGAGIDAAGNLIYVGGDGMNLATLAAALVQAGAVTGMQLDIHPQMVDLFTYTTGTGGVPAPTPLLPGMPGPSHRYLTPDQRDFFAITSR